MVGYVKASAVARWWKDGIVTVLMPAHWCQRRRDPTIIMNGRGRGEAEGEALQRVEAWWWLLWGGVHYMIDNNCFFKHYYFFE